MSCPRRRSRSSCMCQRATLMSSLCARALTPTPFAAGTSATKKRMCRCSPRLNSKASPGAARTVIPSRRWTRASVGEQPVLRVRTRAANARLRAAGKILNKLRETGLDENTYVDDSHGYRSSRVAQWCDTRWRHAGMSSSRATTARGSTRALVWAT